MDFEGAAAVLVVLVSMFWSYTILRILVDPAKRYPEDEETDSEISTESDSEDMLIDAQDFVVTVQNFDEDPHEVLDVVSEVEVLDAIPSEVPGEDEIPSEVPGEDEVFDDEMVPSEVESLEDLVVEG